MNPIFSTKEVATALGVSQSSIKRWCDSGELEMVQTSGGHRRITMVALVEFLRSSQRLPIEPQSLGLPPLEAPSEINYETARNQFRSALIEADEKAARSVVLNLYLARERISLIGDQLIAPVFADIGEMWDCGDVQIYEERRCCEICSRLLRELRSYQPALSDDAPQAVGATPPGDVYALPIALVELVLREQGWNAVSYGSQIPLLSLQKVIAQQQPRLVWLSVSYLVDRSQFLEEYASLSAAALSAGTIIVAGGNGLTPDIRREMDIYMFGDTLRHFELFSSLCYQPREKVVTTGTSPGEQILRSITT